MQTKTTPQLAAQRAIAILGGPAQAARVLDVKGHRHQTVQSWLKTQIPARYCPAVEEATRERGDEVRCEELQPDIKWGVLRGQPTAEPIAQEG